MSRNEKSDKCEDIARKFFNSKTKNFHYDVAAGSHFIQRFRTSALFVFAELEAKSENQ